MVPGEASQGVTIPGKDFADALFTAWLTENPIDQGRQEPFPLALGKGQGEGLPPDGDGARRNPLAGPIGLGQCPRP